MIKRLEITHVHATPDEAIKKYIKRKIGGLDRYIPQHVRGSARAEVRIKEGKTHAGNGATCEVTLHLPDEVINVSETTVNAYAAVDIVEVKLKQLIHKYKDKHSSSSLRRRLMQRFHRKTAISAEQV